MTTNFNTDQWLIVKYPPGAGGKFVASLLFLFDAVEHWYGITDQSEQFDFFKSRLTKNVPWLDKELNQEWGLDFFSRTYLRNNNLSTEEFNTLADQTASDHFKQSWQQGKIIVDHWHKPTLPEFWAQARSIEIIADDYQLLKQMLLTKVFQVDEQNKKIISLVDSPILRNANSNHHYIQKFQNPNEFEYDDLDNFLKEFMDARPWFSQWNAPLVPSANWQLNLSDLTKLDQVINFVQSIEPVFNQTINPDLIAKFHQCWINASFR